jgi:DNA-binding transcriptional ArsR family regulator
VALAIEEYAISQLDQRLAGGTGQIPVRIEREKEDKRLAAEKDQERLAAQLRLIQGGKHPSNTESVPQIAIVGESTRERVQDAKQKYPNASSRELADILRVSQTTVQYHLKRLEQAN